MERVSRILLLFFTLLVSFGKIYSHSGQAFFNPIAGNDFNLFKENGKVGLKDQRGEILIPAEYEAIGWSNGEFSMVENVTGYQSKGMWGLINISNNRLTRADFTDLSPGEGTLIVARKKIPGSVRIQSGCIDNAGKEVIPFQYDGLRISSFRAIVYLRSGIQFRHGLIDFQNRVLIPIVHRNIYPLGSLRYGVENFENKTAIFSEDGKQLTGFLIDSMSAFKKDFAIIYQNQRQGLIDRQGEIRLEPVFRQLDILDDGTVATRQADAWLFLDGQNKLISQFNADSITVLSADLLKIKTGDKFQLMNNALLPITHLLFSYVGRFENGKALFKTGSLTGIIDAQGKIIIKPQYLSLTRDHQFIRAVQQVDNNRKWTLLDSTGHAISPRNYEFIGAFNGKFFPVRNRNYWGAMDINGKEIVACVHDSIGQAFNDRLIVKFKGKYGIINLEEEWIVTPQSSKLSFINNERYLLTSPKTKFLKSFDGQIIYFTDNEIRIKSDHLIELLPSGTVWKVDFNGLIAERSVQPADVESVSEEREGLRAIKKDGRYGFIDDRGRLRIANRYEGVKSFSDGLAATKIRGKWGFINHDDRIAVQPVYDDVTPFTDGYSIVKQKNLFGLIDVNGKLLLPARYDSIHALPGKRFYILQNGLWGLADSSGKILINPKYDRLEEVGNDYVIVQRAGKFGLLTSHGVSTIPQIYDGLIFDPYHERFIALKKASWETVKLQ
jgi:hypothetical protein